MAKMVQQFEIGDVVKLAGGDQKMVVTNDGSLGNISPGWIGTRWVTPSGQPYDGCYPVKALSLVE